MNYDPCFTPALAGAGPLQGDPVRLRVRVQSQLTNTELRQAESAAESVPRGKPDRTQGSGPRLPHPADVIYWIACLGGVGLLLLAVI